MSSLPLISHHLFVAAVNEKSWGARAPVWTGALTPARDVRFREVPLEVIEFTRTPRLRTSNNLDVLRRFSST